MNDDRRYSSRYSPPMVSERDPVRRQRTDRSRESRRRAVEEFDEMCDRSDYLEEENDRLHADCTELVRKLDDERALSRQLQAERDTARDLSADHNGTLWNVFSVIARALKINLPGTFPGAETYVGPLEHIAAPYPSSPQRSLARRAEQSARNAAIEEALRLQEPQQSQPEVGEELSLAELRARQERGERT